MSGVFWLLVVWFIVLPLLRFWGPISWRGVKAGAKGGVDSLRGEAKSDVRPVAGTEERLSGAEWNMLSRSYALAYADWRKWSLTAEEAQTAEILAPHAAGVVIYVDRDARCFFTGVPLVEAK